MPKIKKTGKNKPALSVKTYKSNTYGKNIKIFDKEGSLVIEFVQAHPSCGIKPLNCGASIFGILGNNARIEIK